MSTQLNFGGYMGKLLRVNLTTGNIKEEDLNEGWMKQYLGGRGVASKILMDELEPGIDPLSPQNKLVFITGPLTGTVIPTTSKICISTKSPLTNLIGCGFGGGCFGPQLKFSGYDGIIVEGKAEKPVYIWINDGKAEIKEAAHLWGKDTKKTEDLIKRELKDKNVEVVCIGQAGENKVRFAAAVHGKHYVTGRRGIGAVMGSKNLKAVAVRGTKSVGVSVDTDKIWKLYDETLKIMDKNPVVAGFKLHGTAASVSLVNELGFMPTKNFQEGVFNGIDKVDEQTYFNLSIKSFSCWGCPVHCRRILEVRNGLYAGTITARPEHQTTFALGSCIGLSDTGAVLRANSLCDEYGLDTISTGVTIAFAMECYQRGIIKESDTGGLSLKWGDGEVINQLIKMIALREGFGDILAEGSKRAAAKIGKMSEKYAMQVKGLEIPGYDPRGAKGIGLNYATATRGADHNDGWTIAEELYNDKVDRLTLEGKGKLTKEIQDKAKAIDSAIFCMFALDFGYTLEFISKSLTAITGMHITPEKIFEIGERISNLERIFALREGFSKKDDVLPERFINEELPFGSSKGEKVNLKRLLEDYYKVRDWDENGYPTKEKLERLKLGEYIKYIE